jgi:hypothetical protein
LIKNLILFVLLIYLSNETAYTQYEPIKYNFGKYTLEAVYDTANYCSSLTVHRGSILIFKDSCDQMIGSINSYDLEGNGKKEIVIEYYSGGAHCCTTMDIYKLESDKFTLLDSLEWGNSLFDINDLDKDGKMEITGFDDAYAYAFTNFADSRFPVLIYKFKNGKLYLANKEFKEKVLDEIKTLENELREYTDKGFDCPKTADEETFNTDAGAVQAILAAIVGNYETLEMANKGYELINKVYKCPDKDKFIKILKNEFKLK